jgi:N-acetylneuraminate synthase
MKYNNEIKIANKLIGFEQPTLFIADVAANHDGNIEKAKELIYLAAESGADVAKFQHFKANTIVSDQGFKNLGKQFSHQSTWKKSVYEVYDEAAINNEWTKILKQTCDDAGIIFMTSPYSLELVDSVDKYLSAYKIGSGDITWLEILIHIAKKNKPVLLASGASSCDDVVQAMATLSKYTQDIVLMQCNTNYTASTENFKYIQLNVLKSYANMFPNLILGLSDHTLGCATVLGAVALGARVIEKHFTDDNLRDGPDHKFSTTPQAWQEMVDRTRELELALGNGIKKIENNEKDTVILQRRAYYFKKDVSQGMPFHLDDIEPLRPCPVDALPLNRVNEVASKKFSKNIKKGEYLKWEHLS